MVAEDIRDAYEAGRQYYLQKKVIYKLSFCCDRLLLTCNKIHAV